MSDEWKPSEYAHASIFELSDLDPRDGRTLPEPVFLRFTASLDEIKRYREALRTGPAPSPSFWIPKRVPFQRNMVGPSSSCDRSLKRLRKVCMVPDSVQFLLPTPDQNAENPPQGYFACSEAHILSSNLWFPIPRVIVEFLDRFKLSIGQITPTSLQHLVGILVLGFERGMLITADYLEALLQAKSSKEGYFYLCRDPIA